MARNTDRLVLWAAALVSDGERIASRSTGMYATAGAELKVPGLRDPIPPEFVAARTLPPGLKAK